MAVVDVECCVWTPNGMKRTPYAYGDTYVTVRDLERLLEEADKRGFDRGERSGYEKYKSPTGM